MTKVLFVDDQIDCLNYYPDLIRSWGCEVSTAKTLIDAYEHLNTHYDVLLVDNCLNGVATGFEFALMYQRHHPESVVYGFTAYPDLLKQQDIGLDEIFHKGISMDELEQKIKNPGNKCEMEPGTPKMIISDIRELKGISRNQQRQINRIQGHQVKLNDSVVKLSESVIKLEVHHESMSAFMKNLDTNVTKITDTTDGRIDSVRTGLDKLKFWLISLLCSIILALIAGPEIKNSIKNLFLTSNIEERKSVHVDTIRVQIPIEKGITP